MRKNSAGQPIEVYLAIIAIVINMVAVTLIVGAFLWRLK